MARIKSSPMTIVVFLLILFTIIQSRFEKPFYDDNYIILVMTAILVLLCLMRNRGRIDKTVSKLLVLLVTYAVVFTFILPNNSISTYIYSFFLAFMAYVLIVFSAGLYFGKEGAWNLIKKMYVLISAMLIFSYITHFDNCSVFRKLGSLLLVERDKSSFGSYHANTTADICLSALSLSLLLNITAKIKYILIQTGFRKYLTISNIIICIVLISTTSRVGIIAGVVMYLSQVYFSLDKYVDNKREIKVLKPMMLCIIGGLMLFVLYVNYIKTGQFDITYRLLNFTVNIPTLISENRLLIGWGFVDKSVFANGRIIAGTGYVDNYYLYVLVTTGIVGCIFIARYVFLLIKNICRNNDSIIRNNIISIMIMHLTFC